jgi:hypothetical protein
MSAARCYVHALQHEEADIPGLVDLYAKIDRMRILSSTKVAEIAERFARKIIDTYSEPNKSFIELREMINRQLSQSHARIQRSLPRRIRDIADRVTLWKKLCACREPQETCRATEG